VICVDRDAAGGASEQRDGGEGEEEDGGHHGDDSEQLDAELMSGRPAAAEEESVGGSLGKPEPAAKRCWAKKAIIVTPKRPPTRCPASRPAGSENQVKRDRTRSALRKSGPPQRPRMEPIQTERAQITNARGYRWGP